MNFTWWTPWMIQAKVSLDRVHNFLNDTELRDRYTGDQENYIPYDVRRGDVIGFHNACFTWSVEDGASTPRRHFALSLPGNVFFKPGCINLIVSATGSGKSSMLMALLSEMHFDPLESGGYFILPCTQGVAYAAQEPWIQNETIKDNILFGAPFDEARYIKTLHQCGLEPDILLFEAGNMTEVGEKGLTLSGGQKARVSLARAVYSSARIILLDDHLTYTLLVRGSKLLILDEATSAIDYRTDTAIQRSLRNELPKDVTVITIAHRLQTIMDADRILFLDAGSLVEFDTPERLLEQEGILWTMVNESDDKDTLQSMVKRAIGL